MKRNRRTAYLTVIAVAAVCLLAVSAAALFINYKIALVGIGVSLVFAAFVAFDLLSMRKGMKKLFVGIAGADSAKKTALSDVNIPAVAFNKNGEILWYNDIFKTAFLTRDVMLESINSTFPQFSVQSAVSEPVQSITFDERHYSVFSNNSVSSTGGTFFSLFFDDTKYFNTYVEYQKTRPCVILFSLDNYEDVMSGARDSDKSAIISNADRVIEDFINSTNGVMRKVSTTGYFAVIEEQHIKRLIDERFSVLDNMRKIETGGIALTLSIGVGRGARSMFENQIFARQALDMAMGRGGDQAAVKFNKEFTFFGGAGREVEKKTRIKARTIASALTNIISDSSNVIIVGHKMTDLDAVGASVGLARAVTACGVPVNIAVDEKTTMALSLIHLMKKNGYQRIFISGSEAKQLISPSTLLIIVDTQLESRLDYPELLSLVKNAVVIDHHRMMVGHIERSVLFYHDPHASSCAELVTELLQYITNDTVPATKCEALALLAGIMLDTKFFTLRTGARTFEASAYLKKLGAEPTEAKKLFASNFEIYKAKAELVSKANIYRRCAIAFASNLQGELRLAVPQAADDLLNIDGVSASIVSYCEDGVIYVSARSLGDYNVQLIMENIGGGGHQTMAGVQIENCSVPHARELIVGAIDKYLEEEEKQNV